MRGTHEFHKNEAITKSNDSTVIEFTETKFAIYLIYAFVFHLFYPVSEHP